MNIIVAAWCGLAAFASAQDVEPFMGRWALTLPNNGVGWLGLEQKEGSVDGSILWGGGSVQPLHSVSIEGNTITLIRIHKFQIKGADGKPAQWKEITETISGTLAGDEMKLLQVLPNRNGPGETRAEFAGKRMAPLPPKPDLSKAKFGEPIHLFNGTDLDGWRLVHPSHKNGWSAQGGVLVNLPEPGKKGYGNLRTEAEFEDFNLKLDVKVPAKSNSGIYLRGMYEVQVLDSYGKKPDAHNMGAVYSRIAPSQAVEKEHDVWQHMDITLLNRHVTVILNGIPIIDNQPLLGCTGGALSADETRPGPILLQGNHGAVDFRNIMLTPINSES